MLDDNFTALDMVRFYCNVKVEYKPKERSYTIPVVFLISLLVSAVNQHIAPDRPRHHTPRLYIVVVQIAPVEEIQLDYIVMPGQIVPEAQYQLLPVLADTHGEWVD